MDPLDNRECQVLLTTNAIFGTVFVLGMAMTIMMMVRREINDLFLKYAMYCQILALALSATMCFIITSYNTVEYLNE